MVFIPFLVLIGFYSCLIFYCFCLHENVSSFYLSLVYLFLFAFCILSVFVWFYL